MRGAEGIEKVDQFIGRLLEHCKQLRMGVFNRYILMPFSSLCLTGIERQSWDLGLFRSDHLLHKPEAGGKEASLKQVECDTTSPVGMPLSSRSAALHRFVPRHRIVCPTLITLHSYFGESTSYYGVFPGFKFSDPPTNDASARLAYGLAEATRLMDW